MSETFDCLINDDSFQFEPIGPLEQRVAAIETALAAAGTKRTMTILWSGTALENDTTLDLSDDPSNYDYIQVRWAWEGYNELAEYPSGLFTSSGGVRLRGVRINAGEEGSPMPLRVRQFQIVHQLNASATRYKLYVQSWAWSGDEEAASSQAAPSSSTSTQQTITRIYGIKYGAALPSS